jgi:hypothetical protein
LTRDGLDDVNGLLEPFERSRSSFHEGDPSIGHLGRADDRPGDQYLSGTGVRTQSSRRVQGNASVPVLDGHRLARVDADPDREGERGVGLALLGARGLELDRGPHRLRRGLEHGQGLVAPQLDHSAPSRLHGISGQIGEPFGEEGG